MSGKRDYGVVAELGGVGAGGVAKLDDGRLVTIPESAVKKARIPDLAPGDRIGLFVNKRLGRDVATGLILVARGDGWGPRLERHRPRAQSREQAAKMVAREVDVRVRRPGETRIMLVGRTGVGKSSTINSLLGAEVADVGDFEPETASVVIYRGAIGSLNVMVVDTPGLCDDRPDKGNDARYIEQMSTIVGEIDLLLFATTLDDTRVRSDEMRSLEMLTRSFGEDIWQHTVVALTRADLVKEKEFARVVEGRVRALRKEISIVTPAHADSVPCVPVSNRKAHTPDRQRWLPLLWIAILERLAAAGFVPLTLSMASRLEFEDEPPRESPPKRAAARGPVAPDPTPATRTAPRMEQQSRPLGGPRRTSRGEPMAEPEAFSRQAAAPSASFRAPGSYLAPSPRPPAPFDTVPSADVVVPPLDDILPAEPPPQGGPGALRVGKVTETDIGGVHVVEKQFIAAAGSPVIVNGGEANIIQHVINHRSPGLLGTVMETAGAWLLKKVGALLGFGIG